MSLGKYLKKFLRSSKGQRMMHQAKRELSKPENQRKAKRLMRRFSNGR